MNNKFSVRYWSRSGNTEKLALKIGESLDCDVKKADKPIEGKVEVLFVGAAIYAGKIDDKVKTFLEELNVEDVGKVVVFSTSASSKTAHMIIDELLRGKGISVDDSNFYCPGKFLLANRGRPNADDLRDVEKFALSYLS